jgi:hypothetical protein
VSLLYRSKSNAFWLASLYKKVARITLSRTCAIIFLIILSNISLVLAFFLPLKTLILVGSESTPSYMVGLIEGFEKDDYIIGLSTCAIIFYALYYICTHLSTKFINQGAQSLVKKAKKITIFENQDILAASIYQKVCNVLASLLFFLAGSALGLAITPELFSFFLIFCVIYFSLSISIMLLTQKVDQPKKSLTLIKAFSGICFFSLFAFVIVSYFFGLPFSIFSSIIGLLLSRQILQRITALLYDSIFLLENSAKINSLFYTSLHAHEKKTPQEEHFWSHINKDTRQQWALNSLIDLTGKPIEYVTSSYVQLGTPNIIGLDISAHGKNAELLSEYSAKLFGIGRETSCKHEASLLAQQWSTRLPAPQLVGAAQIGSFNALFFKKIKTTKPQAHLLKLKWYSALSKLWIVAPPASIIDQFSRSKPLLSERLTAEIGLRLISVLEDPEHIALAQQLSESLPKIKELIRTVPLCIVNPDLHMGTILECAEDDFITYNWTRWAVEPIGAIWPTGKQDIDALERYFLEASKTRPELLDTPIEAVALIAIMYALESQFSRQNYLSVIELIPDALAQLKNHPTSEKIEVNTL